MVIDFFIEDLPYRDGIGRFVGGHSWAIFSWAIIIIKGLTLGK